MFLLLLRVACGGLEPHFLRAQIFQHCFFNTLTYTCQNEYGLNILPQTDFFKSKDGELKMSDAKISSFEADATLQWFMMFPPGASSCPILSGQDDVTLIHCKLHSVREPEGGTSEHFLSPSCTSALHSSETTFNVAYQSLLRDNRRSLI